MMKDRFFQFSWRPRNLSLLSADQERDIAKNLKKYSEKFAKDDDMILQQARALSCPVSWRAEFTTGKIGM